MIKYIKYFLFFIFIYILSINITFSQNTNKEEINYKELENKIGQMLMIGFRGSDLKKDSDIYRAIKENLGGVMILDRDIPSKTYNRNIKNPKQLKKLIQDLQKNSQTKLFISIDEEGGIISRLKSKYGFLSTITPYQMGRDSSLKTTKREADRIINQLSYLGFNINFAPTVDLHNNKNPIIAGWKRAFSSDKDIVVKNADIFIDKSIDKKIIPIIKHFPGHGNSLADTHYKLADITNTWSEDELYTFKKIIQNRASSSKSIDIIMVGHLLNKNWDEEPVPFSEKILNNTLRKDIGYDQLIISDDFDMGAISNNYKLEEIVKKSINAGVNILLFSNNDKYIGYRENLFWDIKRIIIQAVKNGEIDVDKIEYSYNKIMVVKRKYKII